MDTVVLQNQQNERAVVLFLGWSMDATVVADLYKPGYDILAVSNFTDVDFLPLYEALKRYAEIVVIGWSFGVRVADEFLRTYSNLLPVTASIAVNGTVEHVSDSEGIAQNVFSNTLSNLNERNIYKFRRRMFNSADDYAVFAKHLPQRSTQDCIDELMAFARLKPHSHCSEWTLAVIGTADAIVPPASQRLHWRDTDTLETSWGHFPDFNYLLTNIVVDKALVSKKFSDASTTYDDSAHAQRQAAKSLLELIQPYLHPEMGDVLEIGAGTGVMTRLYANNSHFKSLTLWDIAQMPIDGVDDKDYRSVVCDAETAILSESEKFDLILSASTIQWFNAPTKFIRNAINALKPGGILAVGVYVADTCTELRSLTGRGLHYYNQSRFEEAGRESFVESRIKSIRMQFDSPLHALEHIKCTGVNALGGKPLSVGETLAAIKKYPTDNEGKYPLTYKLLCLLYRKPTKK